VGELELLTSQRNEIFKIIQDHTLSPSEFEWGEGKGRYGAVPQLCHTRTGFNFIIDRMESYQGEWGFFVRYSPGKELKFENDDAGDWSGVTLIFARWLDNIGRETEIPDLWGTLAKDTQLIQDADQQLSDNLPFTETELPRVRKALEEIKAYVHKSYDLSEAQKRIIDSRFDYLEEKAGQIGRKDWMHIVISILLGIGVDQLRSGESTRDLFLFAREVFKQALGTILYLSGPH
jgi:hypothetical protein